MRQIEFKHFHFSIGTRKYYLGFTEKREKQVLMIFTLRFHNMENGKWQVTVSKLKQNKTIIQTVTITTRTINKKNIQSETRIFENVFSTNSLLFFFHIG